MWFSSTIPGFKALLVGVRLFFVLCFFIPVSQHLIHLQVFPLHSIKCSDTRTTTFQKDLMGVMFPILCFRSPLKVALFKGYLISTCRQ